jgi:hypothetical protein
MGIFNLYPLWAEVLFLPVSWEKLAPFPPWDDLFSFLTVSAIYNRPTSQTWTKGYT